MEIKRNNRALFYLFLITVGYFILGFVNILFALAAFLCLGLPFVLVFITKKKAWCSHYCPRSYWLGLSAKIGRNRKSPRWLVSKKVKKGVLIYFAINFFFITMSSFAVAFGRVQPMDFIRLFIVIPTNLRLYQLIDFGPISPVLLHLSYRLYSVMLSSTIAGTALALLYKPKTWCAVCPINTLSTAMVKKISPELDID